MSQKSSFITRLHKMPIHTSYISFTIDNKSNSVISRLLKMGAQHHSSFGLRLRSKLCFMFFMLTILMLAFCVCDFVAYIFQFLFSANLSPLGPCQGGQPEITCTWVHAGCQGKEVPEIRQFSICSQKYSVPNEI